MSIENILESIRNAAAATTLAEWLVFVTAFIYVILAAIENIWCWLFGILASAFSIYLCYSGQLYLESGLQLFYVIMGAYGWLQWRKHGSAKDDLAISDTPLRLLVVYLLAGAALWIPFWFTASKFSNQALPALDAFITAFSLVATYMTTRKQIENWLFWIVIDALGVWLYAARGFYLIALINIIYTIVAYAGFIEWKKRMSGSSASH